ncbi:tyrosine-type recombinase/integrase [Streptomyces sp. NPDC057686]|uniref:tyrosine-type recombinase/integrase n=1 Tax=Streptomyces sp. NPDC057686 TaxID=3346212 RepID=UPI0036AA13D8
MRAQREHRVPEGTINQYRSVVNRLVARYPHRQFAGIKEADLQEFLYGEKGILVGKDPKTGTSYRSALNAFFSYGKYRGWIKTELRSPKPPFRERDTRPEIAPTRLTQDELVSMLDRAEHPVIRGMVAVGISTALRISDIRKLKVSDVDFETGDIYVWVQKTGRFDALPLTLDLEEEMHRYLTWYSREVTPAPDAHAYLFPGWERHNVEGTGHLYYVPDNTAKCSYVWASDKLKSLFEGCGILLEAGEVWHTIRRSVARIYFDRLRDEVSHDHALRETMVFLGHKNQATTEKYLGLQAEVASRNARLKRQRFIGTDRPSAPRVVG